MDSAGLGAATSPARAADLAVDIVITNHDYGDFLADAIESACAQTHSEVKVVVVDDGSTDGSRELLGSYEDRVDVVLKENGGQASALNAGLARCRGEVVMLLDADDTLRPHAAARVAEVLAADPGLAKVQFRMAYMDAAGHPTGRTKPEGHFRAPVGDQRRAELAFPFDLAWLPGGGTAFRAEVLRRILPIPERDYPRAGADWYIVHLTALLGESAWIDEACADYRVHGRNLYEPQAHSLGLPRIRNSIVYADATSRALAELADELGIERPDPILSVSDLANRLISLKFEPELHPVADDRAGRLIADAVRAVRRRFDISWPMKAMFVAWFVAFAASPRPLARPLAELFQFPERRGSFNRLLGRLYRRDSDRGATAEA